MANWFSTEVSFLPALTRWIRLFCLQTKTLPLTLENVESFEVILPLFFYIDQKHTLTKT